MNANNGKRRRRRNKKKKTKQEVANGQVLHEPVICPLPYDETVPASANENAVLSPLISSRTYNDDETILTSDLRNASHRLSTTRAQRTILCSYPNVKIEFISEEGATTTSSQDTLQIVKLGDERNEGPQLFLQVGEWSRSLEFNSMYPHLRDEDWALTFPDYDPYNEGGLVRITFAGVTENFMRKLDDWLNEIVCGNVEAAPPEIACGSFETYNQQISTIDSRPSLSSFISQGVAESTQSFSHRMIQGTENAAQFMNNSTPKFMEHMYSEKHPAPLAIDPEIEKGLKVARQVTEGAAAITGALASDVGNTVMSVGRDLTPLIRKEGIRVLSTSLNFTEEEASKQVDDAIDIVAGAVGFAPMHNGRENVAEIIGNSLVNSAVKMVDDMYGQQAAAVTDDLLRTIGNVFVTERNMDRLTPERFLTNAAILTGAAIIEDFLSSK